MNDFSRHILIILPSLILANVIHMLIVKYNFVSFLNKCISVKYFGENKKWRGFIIVPFLNSIFLVGLNSFLNLENPIFLGFILGLAYMAFELPNSFFKRKLGIKPGESALNKKYFFVMLDKIDSAFGVALVYYLLGCVNFSTAILLLFVNSLTHILMSLVLVSLKIKSSF